MPIANIGPLDRNLLIQDGPRIDVKIGFNTPLRDKPAIPALLDTGATYCCIDLELAGRLGLKQIDARKVVGAHETKCIPFFITDIFIPELNKAWREEFGGLPLEENGFDLKVIIGRFLLSYMNLHYEGGTGRVQLELQPSET